MIIKSKSKYFKIVMILISLNTIFFRGMTYIGIPLGSTVIPITLILGLIIFPKALLLKKGYLNTKECIILMIFLYCSLFSFMINIKGFSLGSFNNLAYIIDLIYIFIGFYIGKIINYDQEKRKSFINYFLVTFIIMSIYLSLRPYYLKSPLPNISLFGHELLWYSGSAYIHLSSFFFFLIILKKDILNILKNNTKYFSLIVFSFVSLVIYYSRTGYLAFFASIIIFYFFSKDKIVKVKVFKYLLSCLVAFVILTTTFTISGDRNTINLKNIYYNIRTIFIDDEISQNQPGYGTKLHRINMLEETVDKVLNSSPLIGEGFNKDVTEEEFNNPHNGFLTVFFRSGIIGLFSFVMWLIYSLISCLKLIRVNSLALWIFIYLVNYIFGITFSTALENPFHNVIFYFLLGILTAIKYYEREKRNDKRIEKKN